MVPKNNLEDISTQLGKEGHQLIYDICDVSEFRLPGSEGEKLGQEFMEKKLKEFGADDVEVQDFTVYPRFFRWWPTIGIVFFLISLVVFHYSPLFAMFLNIFLLAHIALKILSFQFLDVFFKKRNSSNVIGKLKAQSVLSGKKQKPKMIILFGGHTDSTYEFPLGRKYGKKFVLFFIPVLSILGLWILTLLIISIIRAQNDVPQFAWNPDFSWYYIVFLIASPILSVIVWNLVSGRPVPGANDNLSGVAVATAILKYFAKNRLQDIEIWCVCFGSEEGGMKGSKALAKRFKSQLDEGTFPAEDVWVINFDSIGADGPITIATKEPMYRVKSHHPEVYNALAEACKQTRIDYHLKSMDAGTDSAPFSRLGIPAVGVICTGKEGTPAYWHSREDTPENVNTLGIIRCIKAGLQMVLNKENENVN